MEGIEKVVGDMLRWLWLYLLPLRSMAAMESCALSMNGTNGEDPVPYLPRSNTE